MSSDSQRVPRKTLSAQQVSREATWWDKDNKDYDAVVFVHGILGDQIGTWGHFPALLHDDPDLPKLAILHWGYKSALVPGRYHDIALESQGLTSDLRLLTHEGEAIHLVAHSMGGLIALRSLTQAAASRRARAHPIDSVSLVTLYATPLQGSALAKLIMGQVSKRRWLTFASRFLPRRQLEDLQPIGFVDELQSDIRQYLTPVDLEAETSETRVTVQVVVGKDDDAVTIDSAEGPFDGDPETLLLEGTHSTVKLPDHLEDVRYISLKQNLVRKLSHRLHGWARTWRDGGTATASRMAAVRVAEQYESQLGECFELCFGGRYLTAAEEDAVFTTFLDFAAGDTHSPAELITMTVAAMTVPDSVLPAPPAA